MSNMRVYSSSFFERSFLLQQSASQPATSQSREESCDVLRCAGTYPHTLENLPDIQFQNARLYFLFFFLSLCGPSRKRREGTRREERRGCLYMRHCRRLDERDGFHVFGNLNLFHHTMLFFFFFFFFFFFCVFVCYGRCNNLTSKSLLLLLLLLFLSLVANRLNRRESETKKRELFNATISAAAAPSVSKCTYSTAVD